MLRTLARQETEVRDRDGSWHLMRILPYRTAGNVINGVVITFVNINRLKQAEEGAHNAERTPRAARRRTDQTRSKCSTKSPPWPIKRKTPSRPSNTVSGGWRRTTGGVSGTRCCRPRTTRMNWCPRTPVTPKTRSNFALSARRRSAFGFAAAKHLPGRVLASGKLEWTTDLRSDLIACRGSLAEELGIGIAIAFPVLLGDKVAAVLEFFSDQVIQPNEQLTDAMVGVGLQLGRVIERAEFEEHLLTIAEEVQRGIAQDLHDDVGQELTGLGLKAETLAEMVAPAKTPAGKLAADIAAAVDRTHDKVRGLCRGMLPIELEEGLLAGALGATCRYDVRNSRIECKFACSHPDPVFDSRVSVHLYRIAQEAVANAVRHSGAHNIRITLDRKTARPSLRLKMTGRDCPAKPRKPEGMGLRTMRVSRRTDRWEAGGRPRPSGGTQVVCRCCPPPENAELEK